MKQNGHVNSIIRWRWYSWGNYPGNTWGDGKAVEGKARQGR
jgi:hypothetical protein